MFANYYVCDTSISRTPRTGFLLPHHDVYEYMYVSLLSTVCSRSKESFLRSAGYTNSSDMFVSYVQPPTDTHPDGAVHRFFVRT